MGPLRSNVMNVGVIMKEADHSVINYSFKSLFNAEERKLIQLVCKNNLENLVYFDYDMQPVSPPCQT